jgi:hypothetical protein
MLKGVETMRLDAKELLGSSPASGRRLACIRADHLLLEQTIERGVNGTKRYRPFELQFELVPNAHTVRVSIEPDERKEHGSLEFTQRTWSCYPHHTYIVEEISARDKYL